MASYDFECAEHGTLTVSMPMRDLTPTVACPECGAQARRRYGAPQLALGDSTARRILDATARTAHEPQVVSAPGGRPLATARRRPLADPRTMKLPRP